MLFWKALEELVRDHPIIIDRAKGTPHPRYPDFVYPADYGYLEGTVSADRGGIDVWIGTVRPAQVDAVICTVDLFKKDSEIKILYGCDELEMEQIYQTLNNSSMKGIMVKR